MEGEVERHRFLSEEWVAAVVSLQGEYLHRVTPPETPLKLNGTVNDTPFGDSPVDMSLDTSSGVGVVQRKHLTDADVSLTTDYETAQALFVEADPQAVMQAFFSGKILVTGQLDKLIDALQQAGAPDNVQREVAERIQGFTLTEPADG